ncbi:hypothetical protein BGX26_003655, partial [Mortierella sp. AD094]
MAKELQAFARNTTMSYTFPKPCALDWPDQKSHHAATDKLFKQYQAQLDNLTRPLDQFATGMFSRAMDPEVSQACLHFAQTMRVHIQHAVHQIASDREDL